MIATSFLSMMMFPILVLSGGQADLLERLRKCDPAKSQHNTFVGRMVERRTGYGPCGPGESCEQGECVTGRFCVPSSTPAENVPSRVRLSVTPSPTP